tara:strand:+ start:50 stop:769 length:720 start_codon:yes stop_codon:yes gene_type:complete
MELYNEDCINKMKDLSNNSIDLLFCDLPYGQTSCKWDCLIDLDLFWKEINRICKDECAMFFTCSTKFGVSLINSNPKNFRYDLVWIKSNPCGFLNSKKMPIKKHEMVYVFYKKVPKVYTDNISEHHSHKFLNSKNGMKAKKELVYNVSYQVQNKKYEPPLPNSILEIASQKGNHATQKPVDLIKWCLKYYSNEGDTILDPTMGSGSTGVACKEMNRNFIGIEMDKEIYDVACKRLEYRD